MSAGQGIRAVGLVLLLLSGTVVLGLPTPATAQQITLRAGSGGALSIPAGTTVRGNVRDFGLPELERQGGLWPGTHFP